MKILGIRNVQYTSKKTGEVVRGVELQCSEPFTVDRGVGDSVEKVWLQQEVWQSLNVVAEGDPLKLIGKGAEFVYNKWGRVVGVNVVPASK